MCRPVFYYTPAKTGALDRAFQISAPRLINSLLIPSLSFLPVHLYDFKQTVYDMLLGRELASWDKHVLTEDLVKFAELSCQQFTTVPITNATTRY